MTQYLTIDIGGTFIKYALIDRKLELNQTGKFLTEDSMSTFLNSLEKLIQTYQSQISGLCIACPGQINAEIGYIFRGGLIPYLKNFPLASFLKTKFSLPVTIINDANAAGLAEARYGNLRSIQCGAVLTLGTGVGLALVSNGNLLSFKNFQANDILVSPKRRYPSSLTKPDKQLIQKEVFKLGQKGIESLLENSGSAVQFIDKASKCLNLPSADGQKVFEALTTKSTIELTALFESYCREIAYLILNLQTIFRLKKLLIGGGISSQKLLIEGIRKQYAQLLTEEKWASCLESCCIDSCRFHNHANLIGAFCHFQDLNKLE
ncbi:ROK family protein [Streptococcus macacae]|uniref:ROK family protein n=1 Tax=Streptococcus macacae NCTC 11558 TaxID=764298 RepID=G5JUC0_9STRE|nr:ROK family protein [Streptococcus macacae]EHJ52716.1 ROK family protein [Streptococcus macacae NCTC 11558]SUN78483.1 transcriptional regulator [Streptococcus macacae NCTC 11558]